MKIAIVSGSHRKVSESVRIAHYIETDLKKLNISTYLLSLANNPLLLWDEGTWEEQGKAGQEKWQKLWSPISTELQSADGVVVVAPEWAGMVPAGLKNFFLLCDAGELAHKPGLIVAISSGLGGSYPVAELRTSSYKNSRFCYIPDHLIVRNCEHMFKAEPASDKHDQSLRQRLTYSLKVLIEYAKAMRGVRASGVIDAESYPYGM